MSCETTSSHLPLMEKLICNFKPQNVLEFGMGLYSTPYLCFNCPNVTSIEMTTKEWFDKISEVIRTPRWKNLYIPGDFTAVEWFRENIEDQSLDLVFVDGNIYSRWDAINACMDKNIPFIVAHDTQETAYRWDKIKLKEPYRMQNYTKHSSGVWTSLIYRTNEEIVSTFFI